MQLSAKTTGTRYFDEQPVTITDPGYDSQDTHLTLTNIQVQPGTYLCVAWRGRFQYTVDKKRKSYTRTMICGIYLDKLPTAEDTQNMSVVGTICVDAGMAGFFQNKPDYDGDDWFEFCDKFNSNNSWLITNEGFCTESGLGDGVYQVWGLKNKEGLYTALEIRF